MIVLWRNQADIGRPGDPRRPVGLVHIVGEGHAAVGQLAHHPLAGRIGTRTSRPQGSHKGPGVGIDLDVGRQLQKRHPAAFGVIQGDPAEKPVRVGRQPFEQLGVAARHDLRRQPPAIIGEDDGLGRHTERLVSPDRAVRHGRPMRRSINLGVAVIDQLDLHVHRCAPDQIRPLQSGGGAGLDSVRDQGRVDVLEPHRDLGPAPLKRRQHRPHQASVREDVQPALAPGQPSDAGRRRDPVRLARAGRNPRPRESEKQMSAVRLHRGGFPAIVPLMIRSFASP